MLNRAPDKPYGFAAHVNGDAALLVVSTPDFPCQLDNLRHYGGGDAFLAPSVNLGLHFIENISVVPRRAKQPWMFALPTPKRRAAVFGHQNIKLLAGEQPNINQTWWNRAVMAGGLCRLITTTGLLAHAMNGKIHPETINAHGGHRLVGAIINVEF